MQHSNEDKKICTQEDVRAMLHDVFEEEGGFKDRMLQAYRDENNKTIVKLMSIFGVSLIVSVIGFTLYINTIDNTVKNHSVLLGAEQRFTQQDGRLLDQQIKSNTEILKTIARKEDVQALKESFIRLDERLRNKGI